MRRLLPVLVLFLSACGGGTALRSATPSSPTTPAPIPVTIVTSPSTVAPTTTVETKAEWFHRYGEDITGVGGAMETLTSSFRIGDPHDVATECHFLVTVTTDVLGHPAIPDPPTEKLWAHSLAIVAPTVAACTTDATLASPAAKTAAEDEYGAYAAQLSALDDALTAP